MLLLGTAPQCNVAVCAPAGLAGASAGLGADIAGAAAGLLAHLAAHGVPGPHLR
jgi:hypothetical protein